MLNAAGFVLLETKRLAKAKKLAQVVAGSIITI